MKKEQITTICNNMDESKKVLEETDAKIIHCLTSFTQRSRIDKSLTTKSRSMFVED